MINYWAVIGVAIVGYVILALWYAPFLFGKLWARLTKSKGMGMNFSIVIAGLVAALITSFVLSLVVAMFSVTDFAGGAAVGLLVWIGFVAPLMLNEVLYEKRSFALYLLNAMGYLVVLAVSGGLLAVWV